MVDNIFFIMFKGTTHTHAHTQKSEIKQNSLTIINKYLRICLPEIFIRPAKPLNLYQVKIAENSHINNYIYFLNLGEFFCVKEQENVCLQVLLTQKITFTYKIFSQIKESGQQLGKIM